MVAPAEGDAFAAVVAALAADAEAAISCANVTETGQVAPCERAWDGEGSDANRQRLKGSIVLMKDGAYRYIPVESAAAIFRTSGASGDSNAAPVTKLKLSTDGGTSGQYYSASELDSDIDKIWLGCITVGDAKGMNASNLKAGLVPVAIAPVVGGSF